MTKDERKTGNNTGRGGRTAPRRPDERMREAEPPHKKAEWELALEEVDLPEPAPGGKIITFSLPVAEEKTPRPRAAKKADPEKACLTEADFAAFNKEDYAGLSELPRRRAREAALLLLFAATSGGGWETAGHILRDVGVSGENAEFALALAKAAHDELAENDRLLARYARDWDVERFSSVDRSVLRLALSELRHETAENRTIVINEAIELGKKFGSADSGPFVNAMLDNIARQEPLARAEESTDTQ